MDERVSLLSIRDSGIGIQHDMVDRVFDSFSQAEQSLDRSKGGLGLGLYLVRQVAELHGGKAWASSAGLGDGSEFFIELPLERAPATCTHVVKSPKSWSPQRILVIDDNRLSVRALQLFLKRKGHTVEIAHDGREGLDVARRFKPKVVLCDIGLPEIDGYTVAHEMRHDSALQAVYLIAVSGYGQDEDQLRARKAGFDDYFIKPINLEQIEESLLTGLAEPRYLSNRD
jgi:CheY-like chemotaxis protein